MCSRKNGLLLTLEINLDPFNMFKDYFMGLQLELFSCYQTRKKIHIFKHLFHITSHSGSKWSCLKFTQLKTLLLIFNIAFFAQFYFTSSIVFLPIQVQILQSISHPLPSDQFPSNNRVFFRIMPIGIVSGGKILLFTQMKGITKTTRTYKLLVTMHI